MFNFNGGPGGGGNPNRGFYNPFGGRQGYGETRGWANPTLQGAISLPEKVMGLTCLLVACAIGGVALGAAGLNTYTSGSELLWFIAMFVLVFATQALADRPGIGMVLFLAFGVVTGIVIAPLLGAARRRAAISTSSTRRWRPPPPPPAGSPSTPGPPAATSAGSGAGSSPP